MTVYAQTKTLSNGGTLNIVAQIQHLGTSHVAS